MVSERSSPMLSWPACAWASPMFKYTSTSFSSPLEFTTARLRTNHHKSIASQFHRLLTTRCETMNLMARATCRPRLGAMKVCAAPTSRRAAIPSEPNTAPVACSRRSYVSAYFGLGTAAQAAVSGLPTPQPLLDETTGFMRLWDKTRRDQLAPPFASLEVTCVPQHALQSSTSSPHSLCDRQCALHPRTTKAG